MTAALKRRFDYATELRAFAKKVRDLPSVDRRDPERHLIAKSELAGEMDARAAEVMRQDDPAERGVFRADTVFAGKPGKAARPVQAVKLPRRAGTLGLAA